MVKYTIFVRGILCEDETPLHQSQTQFTIKCNKIDEDDDSLDFIKDNTRIFGMKMDTEDLFLYQGISVNILQRYKNFWWFVGERSQNDNRYTKTWSGGDATKCRLGWRDI